MYFHYWVTFTRYIRCFWANRSCDLVTLTCELLSLTVFRIQRLSCATHVTIWLSYDMNYWNGSHFRYRERARAPCYVTYQRGRSKMIRIFNIPDHNLPIHFVSFMSHSGRLVVMIQTYTQLTSSRHFSRIRLNLFVLLLIRRRCTILRLRQHRRWSILP